MHESAGKGPWLAENAKPRNDTITVEVYGLSMATNYKQWAWTRWGAMYLEPWHIWRYCETPTTKLIDEARKQRDEHGVVALQGNGYYMRREDADRVP